MEVKSPGDVVVFRFPTTGLAEGKPRPALLLQKLPNGFDDWLICMISTRKEFFVEGLDVDIQPDSKDFLQTGLFKASIVRVTRLAIVEGTILDGKIGEVSPELLIKIKQNLADWLLK